MKKVVIYARVSTDKQKVDMQISELRSFAVRSNMVVCEEFIDHAATGSNLNRPAFKRMMEVARKRKFDVLLVWKLDRLSRSLKDLVTTIDTLAAYGIDFISYNDKNIDTTTASGKLMFQIIGAVAEFEKDIIRERVIAGLAAARRKGKRLGRKPLDPDIYAAALKLKDQGISFRKIGKQLGVDEGAIRKRVKKTKFHQIILDKLKCLRKHERYKSFRALFICKEASDGYTALLQSAVNFF